MSTIHAAHVQDDLYPYLDAIRDIVERRLANKGDKSADCQKICLMIAINDLDARINGITDDDLVAGVAAESDA